MFYRIITKLNAYINQESFFISRLIRYNLVELDRHEQQNKYYRMMGFEYLLLLSLIIFCFYYTFGIFHQVQNGCNFENNNGKKDGMVVIIDMKKLLMMKIILFLLWLIL